MRDGDGDGNGAGEGTGDCCARAVCITAFAKDCYIVFELLYKGIPELVISVIRACLRI